MCDACTAGPEEWAWIEGRRRTGKPCRRGKAPSRPRDAMNGSCSSRSRSGETTRADSDSTVQYAPVLTFGETEDLWAAVGPYCLRYWHPARRLNRALTACATDDLWAFGERTNGWSDWLPLNREGYWRLAQRTLSRPALSSAGHLAGGARLGCDGLCRPCGPPRRGRPAALGQTQSRVA